ncbi:hypothetical protein C7Y66_21145 [Chroococcidiopsis sp. CCALA 051]|uniref:hypothetical protein n=1 Tax=Chroococcidiopsis sp. CCALA 051 TaxID=869949 RepID=UPI000D0DE758|nr:hypothetical protein [Chroococcidiopsis sp. CCALA 051]PSM47186.1 hypothetical protein C7Y66_21145 [Chroococcidiopsis sp. CCALA 051]
MTSKGSRMGGLGKLSDFGKTSQPQQQEKPTPSPEIIARSHAIAKPTVEQKQQPSLEKLVNINIKITRAQQQWLADTAREVRDNNDTPVAPQDRVFPQHLIGVAIDLLQDTDIDWSQIKNLEDLRQALKL